MIFGQSMDRKSMPIKDQSIAKLATAPDGDEAAREMNERIENVKPLTDHEEINNWKETERRKQQQTQQAQ